MTGRFAPSPSGRMHLGNVFSAMLAWLSVRSAGGEMVLRIEDLDPARCRPEYVEQLKIPEKKLPLRLKYMYRDTLCTIIDVDEMNRKVEIKNFTDNSMFRAFGNNPSPSFEDYTEFLESRCFPPTRDKMKLVLQDLDLPFYDPFLIIQKTKGKMAEDDFRIDIER